MAFVELRPCARSLTALKSMEFLLMISLGFHLLTSAWFWTRFCKLCISQAGFNGKGGCPSFRVCFPSQRQQTWIKATHWWRNSLKLPTCFQARFHHSFLCYIKYPPRTIQELQRKSGCSHVNRATGGLPAGWIWKTSSTVWWQWCILIPVHLTSKPDPLFLPKSFPATAKPEWTTHRVLIGLMCTQTRNNLVLQNP